MAEDTDYKIIAAIDFGTTYSGYAFQLTSDYDQTDPTKKIFSPQAWNEDSPKLTSLKTPTCLLLDNNEDIDSFGYVAEEKYADLCMDGDNKNWYFFRRFKMKLHDTTDLKSTTMLSDETGRQLSALKVFSKSIECLRMHFSKLLLKRNYGVLPHEIKWVLTVPAIWDDTAKGFMRQAAKEAGILSEHLTIALEPEAASLFCQHLPVEKLSVGGQVKFSDAKPGTTYMIVDLGGGTADITVHEKVSSGKLKEIHRASGGPWGGISVDGAFIYLISSIVGGPVFKEFMKKHTVDYLDLMREFESVKRNVSLSTKTDVKIKIPVSLSETCVEMVKKDFKELVKMVRRDKDITFVGDKVKFNPAIMQDLFRKATDKIVSHMKGILDKTATGKKVSLILMVGGFSESAFVQDVIKAEFHNKNDRKVLIPKEAGISVVQGAVVFGRHPENITSRVLRFSYGAKLSVPFDTKCHKASKKYTTKTGDVRCNDVFDEFIHSGTEVTVGHTVSATYCTIRPFQGDTDLQVYTSTGDKTMYIDEDDCRKLGQLTLKVPNPSKEIRDISVQYIFGDTELHIKAVDVKSNVPCKTTLSLFD